MTSYLETVLPPINSNPMREVTVRHAVGSASGQVVILHGVSWETYSRLITEYGENSGTHFTFDQGTLEIIVLSIKHEALKHALSLLVDILAEELELDIYCVGSATLQRMDLEKGFEADACFYIQNAALVRGKEVIDLTIDPPPDLLIEIDITSPSIRKFPIFAAIGIAEVWLYDGERVGIHVLQSGQYVERPKSIILPKVQSTVLTDLLDSNQQLKRPEWLRQVRGWVRASK